MSHQAYGSYPKRSFAIGGHLLLAPSRIIRNLGTQSPFPDGALPTMLQWNLVNAPDGTEFAARAGRKSRFYQCCAVPCVTFSFEFISQATSHTLISLCGN